jgi:hypothetical protein
MAESKLKEAVFWRPAVGPCAVHDWPTEGMARRLVALMLEMHGRGGVDVCVDCLRRARGSIKVPK